jgi:selenocysteine-specific elongation factor
VHVIGTAGHVDHGKSTLIEALTGINPDRLPEEKERGMTIDLGFAWFLGKGGEPVGVIDVPGHERFIRNMVAGAWSLDCALLLVAADDGWMQQTQDHAVVLQALDVPAVILVITKTDIAAPERVQEVRRDASERCRIIFGAEPPAIEVSALAGKNLAPLKELILATLAGIPEPAIPERGRGFPFLYVDRVFSIKGSGLVVTGSLRGAPLAKDDALELLPAREALRVRAVQSYNSAVVRAMPTSRVALNLQKPKSEIARGACITAPGAPFQCEREIIARVRPIEMGQQAGEKPVIKNHSEVEVALGTGHEIAQIHFLDDPRFARIQLRSPLPALWNQPFLVIRHGGSAILGSGRILWFGEVPKEERRRFTALLAAMPEPVPEEEDRFSLQLRFRGLARRGRSGPQGAENQGPENPADIVVLDEWIFHAPWLEKLSADIVALAGQPAGVSALELEGKLRLDADALRAVLSSLVTKNSLAAHNSLYFTAEGGEKRLPPAARKLLAEILGCERAGYQGGHAELSTLVRLGLVVPLEGGIFYARETYDSIASEILAGRKPGDRFSIPEAKERTGLSRKYMLPLLNRLEKDGRLRREDDARVVL